MKSDRLRGKLAIVTGAGNGIGRGCALMFARHGARVVATDLDSAALQETLALAQAEQLSLASVPAIDLTKPQDVANLVDRAHDLLGGINVLVNAGGWGAFRWLEEMDYEHDWRRTLMGELDVVFLLCKQAWPHLKASGNSAIVNFASANAYVALRGSPALAHCAGKGGVLAMTRQLAMEGGPHRIRANSISPGMTMSAATRPVLESSPAIRAAALDKMMLARIGQPEDIAWAAVYLASDEASWVTGADFAVDGGATAC